MTGAFCVANHIFHLEMPDGHPLWMRLSQYTPFSVQPVDSPLFTVAVVDELSYEAGTPLFVNVPEDKGQARIDLYSVEGGIYAEMAPLAKAPVAGKMVMLDGYRRVELQIISGGSSALFALNNALMLTYAFATASLMTLEMHSSVVMNASKGYLFLGRSGTGKSTHSRLWLRNIEGSELMNDDNPIIRVGEDGIARVYGSPWSGKTPCYRNISAPIGAIVRIRQASHNTITRMSILEAYASVYSSCSGFKADKAIADGLHKTLEHIAINVPCYTMDCLPDDDAAKVCADEVRK